MISRLVPGAEGRDGVEHSDKVGGRIGIGPGPRFLFELEASGQLEPLGFELLARMAGAVLEEVSTASHAMSLHAFATPRPEPDAANL